jgi:RNA polymerase sigma-70 factor, ECF subfamily
MAWPRPKRAPRHGADRGNAMIEKTWWETEISNAIPHLRRQARLMVEDIDRADAAVGQCLCQVASRIEQFLNNREALVALFRALHESICHDVLFGRVDPATAARPARCPGTSRERHAVTLESAFKSLPLVNKEALSLVVIQGLDYQEAAFVMRISVQRLRARLSEGRKLLSATLGAE